MRSQRERNRIATWCAIHEAACAIAWEQGPAATTVEAIAAQAGVSRRTFFNYFSTKEDAVLGTRVPEVAEVAIERFRTSDEDELTRVVLLFVAVARTGMPESTSAQRRQMVAAHPALKNHTGRLIAETERLVTEVIQARFDDVDLASPEEDGRLEALLMLAGVIAKYAFTRYQASSEDDPAEFLRDAIVVFRKVVDTTR